MKELFISIVIPAYNEETNIRLGALDKVSRYLDQQSYEWEVLVVNDGSSDMTKPLIEEFIKTNRKFQLIDNPHQGKAATVITGVKAAKGTYVLFSDLDQATPLKELEKLLPWFTEGFDVVIGSRKGERVGAPILRRIMANGFMILRTTLLGLNGITDTQCGFKAFRREAALDIFKRLELYGESKTVSGSMVTAGFDIEVLFLAKKLGYEIKEVPVEWHYVETRRVNPIKDSWQGLMDIIHIRLNAWHNRYGEKR
jgi:glycosyltransferase involved in cell wall biosynthesis